MTSLPDATGADALLRALAVWHREYADRLRAWPAVAEQHRLAADLLDASAEREDR